MLAQITPPAKRSYAPVAVKFVSYAPGFFEVTIIRPRLRRKLRSQPLLEGEHFHFPRGDPA